MSLPESILNPIMTIWCTLIEVANFDSAFCSKTRRNDEFLPFLNSGAFISHDQRTELTLSGFDWINRRNIKLEFVFVRNVFNFDWEPAKQNLQFCSADNGTVLLHVKELSLADLNSYSLSYNVLVELVNSCVNLISLKFDKVEACNTASFQAFSPNILRQLTQLSTHPTPKHSKHDCIGIMGHVAQHCRSLQSIGGDLLKFDFCWPNFHEILKNNPGITSLRNIRNSDIVGGVSVNDLLLKAIAAHCPDLKTFSEIFFHEEYSLECVGELLVRCKKLTAFSFTTCVGMQGYESIKYTVESDGTRKLVLGEVQVSSKSLSLLLSNVSGLHELSIVRVVGIEYSALCLTGEHIGHIAVKNPNLIRVLEIRKCIFESLGNSLQLVLTTCTELHTLIINQLNIISDEKLRELFAVSNQLTKLSLCRHKTLSTDTLVHIVLNCPKLSLLSVELCPNVDLAKLRAVLAAMGRTVHLLPCEDDDLFYNE